MLGLIAFSSVVFSMTFAPKTEVYIRLVCEHARPEYFERYDDHALNMMIGTSSTDPELPIPAYPTEPKDRARITVPRPSSRCTSDPEVGRLVAGLNATLQVVMGVLSILTTAYWAILSDRVGRTTVLAIGALGNLVADFIFILTTLRASRLPGGYKLFILGSVFQGLTGAVPTMMATSQSYVADCADPSARARMFSLFYAVWFTGMAIGPTLGGLLVTATDDMLSVFYVATFAHGIVTLALWFVIPESLSPEARAANHASREASERVVSGKTWQDTASRIFRTLFGFLLPLAVLLPRKREPGEPGYAQGKRDWNLTLIATAGACLSMLIALVPYKFQYAEAQFGWNSEQLGYFLTGMGVFRSLHLAVVLPLIIRFFAPRNEDLRDTVNETDPLLDGESRPTTTSTNQRDASITPSHHERIRLRHTHRTADFDLIIARASVMVDITAYIFIVLSQNGPQFFAASMLSSFGGGFNPSAHSISLYLMPRGDMDSGKLFGALGVLNALSTQVTGPTIAGAIYMSTVKVFPKAIFIGALVGLFSALAAISLVRLPRHIV
ncbi:MFS general substrate transporter [Clavulina sp. PMI_390]|nr:MFS general substrate transporter [Clavulina sp. PMI_390]